MRLSSITSYNFIKGRSLSINYTEIWRMLGIKKKIMLCDEITVILNIWEEIYDGNFPSFIYYRSLLVNM